MKLTSYIPLGKERFTTTIFLYVFLSMFFLYGSLTVVFMQMQRHSLEKAIVADGMMLSRILAQTARLGVFTENMENLRTPVDALFNHASVNAIRIYTANGTLLFQQFRQSPIGNAAPQIPISEETPPWPLIVSQTAEDTPIKISRSNREEFWMPVWSNRPALTHDSLYFDSHDETSGTRSRIGAVAVTLDRIPLQDAMLALLTRIAGIAILFLLLAGLITYRIVKTATRPLNRLIHKVRELGVADTADELNLLSVTFSQMVTGLEEAFTTIKELNTSLEKKVEARTAQLAEHGRFLQESNDRLERTLLELKNTQSQLVHAEKMAALGQLVAGVAHEVNNTTNFITGALPPLTKTVKRLKDLLVQASVSDATAENHDDPGELIKALDTLLANISEGARRTSKIVQDLKNFSRPGEDNLIKVDLVAALESTLSLLYNEYKYDVEIVRDFEADLPQITCYPSELNQVFLNILLNAIHAVRSRTNGQGKGSIRITIRRLNDTIAIKFLDNGCGIPARIIDKIFDPFFTTKEVGKGTGLGLSVSYGIIKKHQGRIKVTSEEGQGAEFELIMPITLVPENETVKNKVQSLLPETDHSLFPETDHNVVN